MHLKFTKIILLIFLAFSADAVTILAQHEFGNSPGRYTAFPDIYFLDDKNLIGLNVTERNKRSHHDSSGNTIALSSSDCGISWQPSVYLPPPQVFSDEKKDSYRRLAATSWRALGPHESTPDGAYVWNENGKSFIAQGIVERRSHDNGRSWKIKPLSAPKHAVLLNYNSASHLRTSHGTHVSAFYYRENLTSKSRVLFGRKIGKDTNWSLITLPNSDDWPQIGLDETALAELPDGRIIAFIRPDPDIIGYLYYSISKDQGQTWSKPLRSQVFGYPASVILHNKKLLVTVGVRRTDPFAIEAYILNPDTLIIENRIPLDTAKGKNASDFGYPVTLSCNDNLVSVYYVPGAEGSAYTKVLVWKY